MASSHRSVDGPAIVVMAHARIATLARLLRSVRSADIPGGSPLVISIDRGPATASAVIDVAETFDWPHGPSRIIEHDRLGLVEHFHVCGDLTAQYGSLVLLEDDLVVGPAFHRWAAAALALASSDDRVAGVGLATPFFDGYRHLPFEPVLDGYDSIYAQVPWYDGIAWTEAMWTNFRHHVPALPPRLHHTLRSLDEHEWFPDAMAYLVETGRYYLLPRHAHATNNGAAGTHFDRPTDYFQVPLTLRSPEHWRLCGIDDSLAVYDDHLEPTPRTVTRLVPRLGDYDLSIDLLGIRALDGMNTTHVLTTRRTTSCERSWGATMHPLVANLVMDVPGDAIRLAHREAVVDSPESSARSLQILRHHARRGRSMSGRQALGVAARRLRARVRGE